MYGRGPGDGSNMQDNMYMSSSMNGNNYRSSTSNQTSSLGDVVNTSMYNPYYQQMSQGTTAGNPTNTAAPGASAVGGVSSMQHQHQHQQQQHVAVMSASHQLGEQQQQQITRATSPHQQPQQRMVNPSHQMGYPPNYHYAPMPPHSSQQTAATAMYPTQQQMAMMPAKDMYAMPGYEEYIQAMVPVPQGYPVIRYPSPVEMQMYQGIPYHVQPSSNPYKPGQLLASQAVQGYSESVNPTRIQGQSGSSGSGGSNKVKTKKSNVIVLTGNSAAQQQQQSNIESIESQKMITTSRVISSDAPPSQPSSIATIDTNSKMEETVSQQPNKEPNNSTRNDRMDSEPTQPSNNHTDIGGNSSNKSNNDNNDNNRSFCVADHYDGNLENIINRCNEDARLLLSNASTKPSYLEIARIIDRARLSGLSSENFPSYLNFLKLLKNKVDDWLSKVHQVWQVSVNFPQNSKVNLSDIILLCQSGNDIDVGDIPVLTDIQKKVDEASKLIAYCEMNYFGNPQQQRFQPGLKSPSMLLEESRQFPFHIPELARLENMQSSTDVLARAEELLQIVDVESQGFPEVKKKWSNIDWTSLSEVYEATKQYNKSDANGIISRINQAYTRFKRWRAELDKLSLMAGEVSTDFLQSLRFIKDLNCVRFAEREEVEMALATLEWVEEALALFFQVRKQGRKLSETEINAMRQDAQVLGATNPNTLANRVEGVRKVLSAIGYSNSNHNNKISNPVPEFKESRADLEQLLLSPSTATAIFNAGSASPSSFLSLSANESPSTSKISDVLKPESFLPSSSSTMSSSLIASSSAAAMLNSSIPYVNVISSQLMEEMPNEISLDIDDITIARYAKIPLELHKYRHSLTKQFIEVDPYHKDRWYLAKLLYFDPEKNSHILILEQSKVKLIEMIFYPKGEARSVDNKEVYEWQYSKKEFDYDVFLQGVKGKSDNPTYTKYHQVRNADKRKFVSKFFYLYPPRGGNAKKERQKGTAASSSNKKRFGVIESYNEEKDTYIIFYDDLAKEELKLNPENPNQFVSLTNETIYDFTKAAVGETFKTTLELDVYNQVDYNANADVSDKTPVPTQSIPGGISGENDNSNSIHSDHDPNDDNDGDFEVNANDELDDEKDMLYDDKKPNRSSKYGEKSDRKRKKRKRDETGGQPNIKTRLSEKRDIRYQVPAEIKSSAFNNEQILETKATEGLTNLISFSSSTIIPSSPVVEAPQITQENVVNAAIDSAPNEIISNEVAPVKYDNLREKTKGLIETILNESQTDKNDCKPLSNKIESEVFDRYPFKMELINNGADEVDANVEKYKDKCREIRHMIKKATVSLSPLLYDHTARSKIMESSNVDLDKLLHPKDDKVENEKDVENHPENATATVTDAVEAIAQTEQTTMDTT